MSALYLKMKYLTEDTDKKSGKVRLYVRPPGLNKKFRIRATPGTPEFMDAYYAALEGRSIESTKSTTTNSKPVANSWRELCIDFMKTPSFYRLEEKTQRTYRAILEKTWREPAKPDAPDLMGDCPMSVFAKKHVVMLRDRRGSKPAAANSRLKLIKRVLDWALEADRITRNPADSVHKIKYHSTGFHTWTVAEMRQFEAHHPIGSKARLAFAILAFTGVRRSDAIKLGASHLVGGKLQFTVSKNAKRNPIQLSLPILKDLAEAIDACPSNSGSFIETEKGEPYTVGGFGNWFRRQCNAAGLPHCSAHGIRKAAATIAAERGATEAELMAIFGWRDSRMAQLYIKAAKQSRLAENSMEKLSAGDSEIVPYFKPSKVVGTNRQNTSTKSKGRRGDGTLG